MLPKDLNHLINFPNLKKLDLSNNQLTQLPNVHVFAGLTSLKFLYLHNNNITKWQDLQSLTGLTSIIQITLFNNPVCQVPGYRHYIVNSIQGLKALDNYIITDEERIEDASFGYRFRALNEFMKLHIPDYTNERSADQHLLNLEVDIYRLKRIFERNSPSILIQSFWRGCASRSNTKGNDKKRTASIIKLQAWIKSKLTRIRF